MNLKLFLSLIAVLLATSVVSASAGAAGFGAGISPTKFELHAKPGAVIRDTLTILNTDIQPAQYLFRTADWRINASQGVDFFEDSLLDGSCRPWVRLERKSIRIRGGAQKTYRFEVHVPADAAAGLCTFAVLIEPGQPAMAAVAGSENIKIPVVGRYAAIVYVTIGDARAKIEYLGLGEQQVRDLRLPTVRFRNTGQTYDRAFGQVMATGQDGKRHRLIAGNFPVLPNRSEAILLSPDPQGQNPETVAFNYPLRLQGKIEIGGETFAIDEVFE